MFKYQQYHPSAQLAGYIECYWILRTPGHFIDTPDRLVPGGRIEMIFNFADPVHWLISEDNTEGIRAGSTIFMGQRNKVFYAKGTGKANMFGVRFKPGGLTAFTNLPAADLLNAIVPAEFIFGNEIKNWETRLQEETTDEARIRLLDSLMKQALKNIPRDTSLMHHAIHTLRNNHDDTSIAAICDQTGYNYKKLERVFIRNAGYTPKYYHKVLRFNKAVRLMESTDSLTKICYECNYFDQAHFIRDFRRFTGTTPGQFKKADNRIASLLIKHQPV